MSETTTAAGRNGHASINGQLYDAARERFLTLPEARQSEFLTALATDKPLQSMNGHGPNTNTAGGDILIPPVTPVAELLTRTFDPLVFLVDGIIARGHLAMLGGRPKSGKSWLGLQLAQAIDTGAPFLGRTTKHARALYIALEDGERRVYQRCQLLRWKPTDAGVLFAVARFDGDGGPGPGVTQIAHWAADYKFIVVDTLIATLSGRANENDNTAMGAIVNELARVAHETDAAILLIHHTGKGAAENVFDTLRGASALRGGYDVGMVLERKQDEREAVLHMESRDVDLTSLTIRQADSGAGWEALGTGAEIKTIRAGRRIVEAIRDHGDGQTAEELATAIGISPQTVRKQLTNAEDRGLVKREKVRREGALKPVDIWFLTG